jgi:hypothetical protein
MANAKIDKQDVERVLIALQTQVGGITPAVAQANSTATDAAGIVTDFNALLAKLRTAGILKTS